MSMFMEIIKKTMVMMVAATASAATTATTATTCKDRSGAVVRYRRGQNPVSD